MRRSRASTSSSLRLIADSGLEAAAESLRALAHPHRLRIAQATLAGRFTVNQLADACGIAPHVCSEHLRHMQRCGLLAPEKVGRHVYYRAADGNLAFLMTCVEGCFGGEKTEWTPPSLEVPNRAKPNQAANLS